MDKLARERLIQRWEEEDRHPSIRALADLIRMDCTEEAFATAYNAALAKEAEFLAEIIERKVRWLTSSAP